LSKVKLDEIVPEPSAARNTVFKVIRSNIEITITPPRIARLRSHITGDTLQMLKVKGQKREVMYQQQ